jgi:predicted GIY-YIG superfamily endonuclease
MTTSAEAPTLLKAEIERLTGYKRPADQLRELHRQGFWRARRARNGKGYVVVETPHFHAVQSGVFAPGSPLPTIIDITPALALTPRREPARPIDWTAKTALYRHFDKQGRLLYIGVAVDPKKRESAHRCYSPWAADIHEIRVEWLEDRHAALVAERSAIQAEKPLHNILHQQREAACPAT